MKAEDLIIRLGVKTKEAPPIPIEKVCEIWLALNSRLIRTDDEQSLFNTLTTHILYASVIVGIESEEAEKR